jgi:hypothetical protein
VVAIGTIRLSNSRIIGDSDMRCAKHPPMRNKIDPADTAQVRILKRRLGISGDDLLRVVEKAGNSIAAVTKEVALQKAGSQQLQPMPATTDAALQSNGQPADACLAQEI